MLWGNNYKRYCNRCDYVAGNNFVPLAAWRMRKHLRQAHTLRNEVKAVINPPR